MPYSSSPDPVAVRFAAAIDRCGLSYRQAARLAGCTHPSISRWLAWGPKGRRLSPKWRARLTALTAELEREVPQ